MMMDSLLLIVGGTELVLKCSSLDPGNFPSEWRPVSNVAMMCYGLVLAAMK